MVEKVKLDLSKVITNLRGEPAKDMIDPPANLTDPSKAPNLTVGGLISQGLMIGIQDEDLKNALKYFQLAGEIQNALVKDGFLLVDEGKISQIEEAFGKIRIPSFKSPMYAGAVVSELNRCKLEIMRKNQPPPS